MNGLIGAISVVLALSVSSFAAETRAAGKLLQEVKERGSLRGCFAQSVPWQIKNPTTGEWEGYNADAARNLAESLGVKYEPVDATWGTLIPNLTSGRCDIVMVDMFATPQRAQVVLFSEPWGYQGMEVVVHKDAPFKTAAELDSPSITLVANSGSANHEATKRLFPKANLKTIVTDTPATIMLEVGGKRADGATQDSINIDKFLAANPQVPVRRLGDAPFNLQGMAYALPLGEQEFKQYVDAWQKKTIASGAKAQWWQKWLGKPLPPEAAK